MYFFFRILNFISHSLYLYIYRHYYVCQRHVFSIIFSILSHFSSLLIQCLIIFVVILTQFKVVIEPLSLNKSASSTPRVTWTKRFTKIWSRYIDIWKIFHSRLDDETCLKFIACHHPKSCFSPEPGCMCVSQS